MTTMISDVIVPEVFANYSLERTRNRSRLWAAGVYANDPRLNNLAVTGGVEVNVPFWGSLEGSDEILSDNASLTPSKITTGNEKAHVFARGKAWSANDLAAAFSGDDPMGAIATQTADWWNQRYQDTLCSILKGIFGTSLKDQNSIDLGTVDASTGSKIDATSFVDAESLLADAGEEFAVIYMHSNVYYSLKKQNLVSFEGLDSTDAKVDLKNFVGALGRGEKVPTFGGMIIIHERNSALVDNAATGNGKVYTTYMFRKNSIGHGDANAPVPVEVDRDKLAGNDILIQRRHYLLHPYGMSFNASGGGALAGSTPSNAELATAAKWSVVTEDNRNIGIVRIRSNG